MNTERPERFKSFILVGAPGCGKGTQGSILGAIPRFFHFSTGDAFRRLDTRTEIGQEFIKYSSKGELVPDELTVRFFRSQIDALIASAGFKPDIDILVLDGIPRNSEQARLLEEHVEVLQLFHLSCPDREELITRIRKRALKQGRLDDANEDIIRNRIQTYEEETRGLIEHYSHISSAIDANQPPVKVLDDIIQVILKQPEWKDFISGD
ncbi:UNVERIFIED_CONTAM: hypothetical protein GTU68_059807 [Idotea baltica]|nr:hypothetical protein [Idotea baltica]